MLFVCAEIEFFVLTTGSYVQVPWSQLGQEPVIMELDHIFVLAEPATDMEGGDAGAVQDVKNAHVKEGSRS
jgi:hypothetical protein